MSRYASFQNILPIALCLLFLATGCQKKEKTTWDTNLLGPLLKTTMGMEDLLGDSLMQTSADSSVSISFQENIYEIPFDSLVNLPDTTVSKKYALPFPGTVTLNPGQVLVDQDDKMKFDVGDLELNRVVVRFGEMEYSMKSTIPERTLFTYEIPGATKNGQPFSVQKEVPAGSNASPSVKSGTIDLTDYSLDLTGAGGGEVNTLNTKIEVKIHPDGNSVTVDDQDTVSIATGFTELIPQYVKGYFGQQSFDVGPENTPINTFQKIHGGALDIKELDVDLILDNGVGMDARSVLESISASNSRTGNSVSLQHNLIGTPVNLTRAQDDNGVPVHQIYTYHLDEVNSNVDDFLEVLPDSLGHELSLETNPMGNVSSGNDFLYYGHGFSADLKVDMPLEFSSENLYLIDTSDFSLSKEFRENGLLRGTLMVFVNSNFPVEATVRLHPMIGNTVKDTLYPQGKINAAPLGSDGKTTSYASSTLETELPASSLEILEESERMLITIRFSTMPPGQHLKIFSHYSMDFKITGDFHQRITYQ